MDGSRGISAIISGCGFAFNAHTTANEALWAGRPSVAKLGISLAARVAGSILNAIGLPKVITYTEVEYEARILE